MLITRLYVTVISKGDVISRAARMRTCSPGGRLATMLMLRCRVHRHVGERSRLMESESHLAARMHDAMKDDEGEKQVRGETGNLERA